MKGRKPTNVDHPDRLVELIWSAVERSITIMILTDYFCSRQRQPVVPD